MDHGPYINRNWSSYNKNRSRKNPSQSRRYGSSKQRPRRKLTHWLVFVVLCFIYLYVSTSLWIFDGPFHLVRTSVIDTLDETRHGYLLRPISLFTVSNAEIKAHALTNGGLVSVTAPVGQIANKNFNQNTNSTIHTYTYHGKTFTAHIMVVSDPNRVKVAATKYIGVHGETVQQMVSDVGAVAGINGGAFNDAKQQGTGAYPQGITIHNGKVITGKNSTKKYAEIAFTSGGQLIAGDYSLAQLKQENVQEALSFGPVLVLNGKPVPTPDQGYNPRTAIGQTADGKVILIVTDGRGQFGHIGASLADVSALMLKYHAVIAANLDGGSSTTMVYHNKLLNTPVDLTGERSIGTSVVVMPEGGGH